MGWLKKLPRWIRPPAKVRNVLQSIKGSDIINPIISTIPGGTVATTIAGKIKNAASQSGGIIGQAGGLIQDARGAAQAVKQQEDTLKKLQTVLIVVAVGLAVWFIFIKRR